MSGKRSYDLSLSWVVDLGISFIVIRISSRAVTTEIKIEIVEIFVAVVTSPELAVTCSNERLLNRLVCIRLDLIVFNFPTNGRHRV